MAQVITMPRLSDTMTDGTVATWIKKVGDKINEGDILAEIETDKATMEFESFYSGTLLHIGVQEGETAPVDSVLAIIGKEGEDISALLKGETSTEKVEQKEAEVTPQENNVEDKKSSSDFVMPEGVKVVTMPRLSDTMTDGTVASWIKKVGDKVNEGDILAEIETDKATMEFESFNSGTLLYIGVQEGESAPVDSILAIIGKEGIDISGVIANFGKEEVKSVTSSEPVQSQSPKADMAESSSVVEKGGRIFASPLAKKIAEDKGINLSQVTGTGENGRITKADVENFTPSAQPLVSDATTVASSKVAPQSVVAFGQEASEEVKNSQMRKVIAKRLSESKYTAPHYYLNIEVNMDNAIVSRATINSVPDTKVSFNDMVIKAVAMALRKHPKVNSQWKDDATIIHNHVHIGVAVAVEEGLVVPVVKFADSLTLSQIGASVKDLATRSRNKKIQPNEMEGSTFTISNLGMFGIESFTSIINQPNSAILSVGAIVEKPVVKNGQIVVGNTMMLTLACDHRTVDGATGAEFLQTLRQYIENPVTMLA
ncbi:MAG: pyruvate dehydrogenase complex dihydrolipoamide acetyltransferase [Flavobacteriaceae bacterium]|jgi:pyruvate dehydrogenase E2 component (dihydrolipoamide acetyltransferase)|nr:pyruvate dehydrogenase complex dihydrolipoamide acetyltransferase [Flavobacteriaceae bacterium]